MAISTDDVKELIESVFDFDHVGDAMLALRKNLDSAEAKADLTKELIRAASEEVEDNSPENQAVIESAAKARVEQFIKGSKYSQSGCSGL
jgi:transcriptional regulatory protein LevR